MPASRHKQLQTAQRREKVADLYLQGHKQMAIAEMLGVGQGTICEDLKRVRQEWLESSVRNFDVAKEKELQKLDRVEREAWAEWDRSKQPAQSAVVTGEDANKRTTKSVKNQTGDPRYLDVIHKCIAQRRAILGLDALPTLMEPDADAPSLDVRRDRVITLIATLRERERNGGIGTTPPLTLTGDVCAGGERGEVATRPALDAS
ncbi:MAG TPA: hypothetical protein VMP01_28420 [Pirellulaceae bacterium]|nr:hypothetical protein [Pirellulaceae bacterium]